MNRPEPRRSEDEIRAASLKRLRVDPRSYRIRPLLFKRIWRLAKPYWTRPGAWGSWLVYALLLGISGATASLWAWSTSVTADLTNAIVQKNPALAWSLVWLFALVYSIGFLVLALAAFIDSRLELHWRRWLTRYLVERYLKRRTYYDIALREDLDNPDQRMQEDVLPFVHIVTNFPRRVITNLMMMVAGGAILASVTSGMFWFVLGYAVLQTISTLLVYTPTIKQNFELTVAEADLRYGILHVRDNAETVAFYRGEYAEARQIEERLSTTVGKQRTLINYRVFIEMVNTAMGCLWQVGPYFLLLPLFFADRIEFGAIAQATMAASAMVGALSLLSNYLPEVTAAAPRAVRLAEILERFDALDETIDNSSLDRVRVQEGTNVQLSNVSLETPGGEQALLKELSVALEPGQNLVIIGQTGVGKSSVLRAMAGLWSRGSGHLTMPPAEQCLFLPQRPYMILADLRSQLLYPHGDASRVSDEEIAEALARVRLPDLVAKHGGLDMARDWAKVLSLGEQQRIGFARILISRPKFVFLDEATSAVDVETEAHLYGVLRRCGATWVSVGHRETILRHHEWALQLLPGGSWKLMPIDDVVPFRPRPDSECGEGASRSLREESVR